MPVASALGPPMTRHTQLGSRLMAADLDFNSAACVAWHFSTLDCKGPGASAKHRTCERDISPTQIPLPSKPHARPPPARPGLPHTNQAFLRAPPIPRVAWTISDTLALSPRDKEIREVREQQLAAEGAPTQAGKGTPRFSPPKAPVRAGAGPLTCATRAERDTRFTWIT